MRILDYLLYASCRPCSHYIPRPRKRKSKWYRNRKKVHELERMSIVDEEALEEGIN